MKKLKLNLDDLQVETFHTVPDAAPAEGTVQAYISPGPGNTCDANCTDFTCGSTCTCGSSCGGTCDVSCNGTCSSSCNGTCSGSTCEGTCGGSTCSGCGGGATCLGGGCDTSFACSHCTRSGC